MKRKTVIILFLLALFVLVIALWPSDDNGNNNDEGTEFVGEEGEEKLPPEIKEMTQYVYEPVVINVHQNTTFQEALYVENTYNIQQVEERKNIGGTKLIAEMSADVDGMPKSRNPNGDCTVNIYPLNVLKIHLEENTKKTTNVFWRIHNTTISMLSSKVSIQQSSNTGGDDWESLLGLLGDFIDALLNGCKMEVNLILINNTSKPVVCEIPQGQMLETEAEDAQNLVVSELVRFTIEAKQQIEITVPVYCAAHKRGSPVDSKVRFTPYVLNAPRSVYESQQDVWNYIEAPARNRIVFYCWGKGQISGSGQISKTGHAFVYIPDVGYQGFGTEGLKKHFGIYEKGAVFDHSRSAQYATDSCVCYITDMQLAKAKAKYYEWKNNTPHYTIGSYDCTTFAMDIADAAEIYYGWRKGIQTPVGFMQQMKKYNNVRR